MNCRRPSLRRRISVPLNVSVRPFVRLLVHLSIRSFVHLSVCSTHPPTHRVLSAQNQCTKNILSSPVLVFLIPFARTSHYQLTMPKIQLVELSRGKHVVEMHTLFVFLFALS